jgi:cyclohexadieny/prephenate dehydrogenase
MSKVKFDSVLIIGVGLIGSSLARAIREYDLAKNIYGLDTSRSNLAKCNELQILSKGADSLDSFSEQFDLVIICSPLSTYKSIFASLNSYIKQDTLVTDVGSTKMSVIRDFKETVKNSFIQFLPSHPIAGLEKSGAEFGFSQLFENRFCIITPINTNSNTIKVIKQFWTAIGMQIETMDAEHHDRVLAMTSHIPQLIAYSIVATASELETHIRDEVIKYSAAGFRDFTRLAGSDPIMWRDVYSLNKDAVLEMLGRFTEDLSTLQKAIRNNDSKFLEKTFSSTREIRKIIEKLGQAGSFDPRENKKK